MSDQHVEQSDQETETPPADATLAKRETSVAGEAIDLAARIEASSRSRIRRHRERRVPAQTEAILRAGRVAHIAFCVRDQPFIIPCAYDYDEGVIYAHASIGSRLARTLREGTAVAIEVTQLDGLVASREAHSHSMNYRSVVVFGRATVVSDLAEKSAIFARMTARYFPGRTLGRDYQAATEAQLRGVELMAIPIEEASAKSRSGPPLGPDDADPDAPGSAGVVLLPGLDS
ncbi:MAG TPA: pyridoxamine 5'-phosphate oxidase family protein [Ktedonobacterales bacterium]|nr:pyridoxamine 5'-phosphate oxidase family protein [Ktedonobacterales bacterium]